MPLNPAQKQAVEYLEGPLLVLAGPGTGKTQLLSAKVAYILQKTDANPDNILCLTFTDAGAQNMRDRLQTMIGQDAQKVNIHTYHAFGKTVLDRYQNYAEAPERQLETAVDDTAQHQILARIQKSLPARDILKKTDLGDLLSTIGNAKSARLTPADLSRIADQNLSDGLEIAARVSPIFENATPRARANVALTETYHPILEQLTDLISPEPIVGNIERLANTMARDLNHAIQEVESAEKPVVKPLTAWKSKYFELSDEGYRLKDHIANKKLLSLAHIMQEYEEYLESHKLFDFNDMIECAIRYLSTDRGFRLSLSEQFQYILLDEFQDTNTSQFDLIKLLTDYERPVIMAVGDDDQAIYAFQGANASNLMEFREHYQAEVISLTTNYRSTGEILALSRHIADQIEDSFVKSYPEVTKVLTSFKDAQQSSHGSASSTATAKTSSSTSSAATAKTSSSTSSTTTTTASATATASPAGPIPCSAPSRISRHEFPCASAEYYWVASEVRRLLDAGADPTEIAILAPKHQFLVELLPYLKAKNIDITYEKRDNLLEDEKCSMLITLATFLFDLASGRRAADRLLEILTFPFWEIPATDVINLFGENADRHNRRPTLDYLKNSDHEKLEYLADLFAALVAKSFTAPLELWLSYLLGTTPLEAPSAISTSHTPAAPVASTTTTADTPIAPASATPSTLCTTPAAKTPLTSPFLSYYESRLSPAELLEFYESLATLRETVLAHATGLGESRTDFVPHLADFVATINDYLEAEKTITRTSTYRDAASSVQVMTAFKSKGLEFEHVFLTSMDDTCWGRAKGNNDRFALPKNLLPIRHTGATDDERLRLLFVAITRAKSSLVMTNSRTNLAGKPLNRLSYLSESSPDDQVQYSPYLPKQAQTIQSHADELSDQEKITTLKLAWTAHYAAYTPDLAETMKSRLENYRLSASHLTSFLDLTYSGPQALYARLILRAPEAAPTPNQLYGTLIHKVFEEVTRQQLSDPDALDLFRSLIPNTDLEPDAQKELEEFGLANLEIALASFGSLLRSPHAKPEVNLASEHLVYNGVPITGTLDHIEIDPEQKTIEIYDYKTGAFRPAGWAAHPTNFCRRLQLGFYKLLLEQSPTYRSYRVTRGHILYVTPDADNAVHCKDYDYNTTDDAELATLVEKVYHLITSLEFVNNPDLFLPADRNNGMKQIRAFIDQILE